MKISKIIILLVLVLISCLTYAIITLKQIEPEKVDTVAVNEITKTVEQNWHQLTKTNLHQLTQPFTVIDTNGQIRYRTSSTTSSSLNEGIQNRDTIIDLYNQNQMIGKLLIYNQSAHSVKLAINKIQWTIVITILVLTLLCISYLLYLQKRIFKPFHQLKGFAHHIARGNFDFPLQMQRNNLFGAFTESFDLMREELATAKQNEYLANQSKKELVASLSHDIKTPVATIKAVSELMLIQASTDKSKKQLHTIYAKAEQIDLLITDMFHATLEELQQLKVYGGEEYSTVIEKMIVEADYKQKAMISPVPECLIYTDTARLQQVFDNIISNSYKYADTPIKIDFTLSKHFLEIAITDFGNGVNEDELPLLSNKFFRGLNAEQQTGSGLGLYISSYLMQEMQGDMNFVNQPDGFTVILRIKVL